VIELIFMK